MSIPLAQLTDRNARDIKRRVVVFLSQKGVSSVGSLRIQVKEGIVTFGGTVSSLYERQLCRCCTHLPGVRKIIDDLDVKMPSLRRCA